MLAVKAITFLLILPLGGNEFFLSIFTPQPAITPKLSNGNNFFSTVTSKIDKYPNVDCVLIGGDFNCVLNNSEDRSKTISYSDKSVKSLGDMVRKHDLEDI